MRTVGRLWDLLGAHGQRFSKVASATLLAQAIPVLISPVLTRQYSPAEFGSFALFLAVTAVLGAVATGRYHLAIMLPDSDRQAAALTWLSCVIAACFTATALAAVGLLAIIGGKQWLGDLGYWLFLAPIAALVAVTFETLSLYALRRDQYGLVARASATRAIVASATQVTVGAFALGRVGLIAGSVLGLACGQRQLSRLFLATSPRLRCLAKTELVTIARRYSKFPKFELGANLANVLSYSALIVALAYLFNQPFVGQFVLAYRVLGLPSAAVGTAAGQVFFREASIRRHDPVSAKRWFDKSVLALTVCSIPPFFTVLLYGETLFALIFGLGWSEAGLIAVALVPAIWMRFIASPISTVFIVHEKTAGLLALQLAIFVGTAFALGFAAVAQLSAIDTIRILSGALALIYAALLAVARWLLAREA